MKLPAHAKVAFLSVSFLLASIGIAKLSSAQDNYDVVIANGRVMDPESG